MSFQPDAGRSRVVLIGVARYDHAADYPPLPSVTANIDQLYEVLGDDVLGRLGPALLPPLHSPRREEIVDTVGRAAEEAESLLLCYFSGHGQLVEEESGPGRLHLQPREASATEAGLLGIRYAELRDLLCRTRAERVVLILDCCFSGNARLEPLRAEVPFALVTSSRPLGRQDAGDGRGPTPFTAALLDILREGTGSPDGGPVTVAALRAPLRQRAGRDAAAAPADSDPDDWQPYVGFQNGAEDTVLSQAIATPPPPAARQPLPAWPATAWRLIRKHPARALLVAAGAALAGTGLLALGDAIGGALHPPPPDCPVPLELRILTSPEYERPLARVLETFEGSAAAREAIGGRPAGCRQLNAFVYAAPDGDAARALGRSAAWAEPERTCAADASADAAGQECAQPLRDIGPRPDVWLPSSSIALRGTADAVDGAESAAYPGEPVTVATSPAVVLLPGEPPGGLRRSGEPLERLLEAAGEQDLTVLRARPAASAAALLHGMTAGPGGIQDVPLPPADDAALLCSLARPAGGGPATPAPALLVAERTAVDLVRAERRPACLSGAAGAPLDQLTWDQRYRAYYPGDVPPLDLTFVPVHWEHAADDDAERREAIGRLGAWLGSAEGMRALGAQGFRDPRDERRALIEAPPLNHEAFVTAPALPRLLAPDEAAAAGYLRAEESRQGPRDVVFVVDVSSGSYAREAQYAALLRTAIGALGPEDGYAVLATPGGGADPVRTVRGLAPYDGADGVRTAIDALAPVERHAPITPALEAGLALLTPEPDAAETDRGRLVVLITDDEDSAGRLDGPADAAPPVAVVSYGSLGCEHLYNRMLIASGALCFDGSGSPGAALAGTLRGLTAPWEP
ncbi:hypothetical protein ACFC1B_24770 [Streptomyces xiamenensis]|uniref:hypothetical protein n=1 Tax=Streptomyces xiamenensis TaxID=408015 RepID=UPI0035DDCF6E